MDIYGIPITGYVRILNLQYSVKDLLEGMKGEPQHSVTSKTNDSKIPHGTQIILKPDTSIFESTEFSKEKLQNWISENYYDLKGNVVIK